jgi:hypothetical protein
LIAALGNYLIVDMVTGRLKQRSWDERRFPADQHLPIFLVAMLGEFDLEHSASHTFRAP